MKFLKKVLHLLDKSASECKPLAAAGAAIHFVLSIGEYLIVTVIVYSVFHALETGSMQALLMTAAICAAVVAVYLVLCYFQNVYIDLNWFRVTALAERRAVKRLHRLESQNPIRAEANEQLLNTIRQGSGALSVFFSAISRISSAAAVLFALMLYSFARSTTILCVVGVVLALTFVGLMFSRRLLQTSEPFRQQALASYEKSVDMAVKGIALRCFGKEAVSKEIRRFETDRKQLRTVTWKQTRALSIVRNLQDSLSLFIKGGLPRWFYSDYANQRIAYDDMAAIVNSYDQVRQVIGRQVYPYQSAVQAKPALKNLEKWYHEADCAPSGGCQEIRVRSLGFEADGKTILQDISFTLKKGEHVALIGANGSGKTTLLRCLMGFLQPQAGQIEYGGQALEGLTYKQRRRFFTWIPNQATLFSGSLAMNLQMNQEENEQVDIDDLLEDFDLNKEKSDAVDRFSDGEQQRVNILRALAHRADWLIGDEPTARLQRSLSYDVMKRILNSSESCLIITHQEEQLALFDRVLVLDKGKLVYDGSAAEYCLINEIN